MHPHRADPGLEPPGGRRRASRGLRTRSRDDPPADDPVAPHGEAVGPGIDPSPDHRGRARNWLNRSHRLPRSRRWVAARPAYHDQAVDAVVLALAWPVLLVSVLLTLTRFLVVQEGLLVEAACVASYAVLGYVAAAVLFALLVRRRAAHRWTVLSGTVLAVLGVLLHLSWLAPLFVGARTAQAVDVTVMTCNLGLGQADAGTLVRTVVDRGVDVLVLEEVTRGELRRLDRSGLAALYPHRAGNVGPGSKVTMVFSTYPLRDAAVIPVVNGGIEVTVAAAAPFRLLGVHTANPRRGVRLWSKDLRTVRDVAEHAVGEGPTVLAGDFNATTDHALFRRILGVGLSDATAQANSGWQPTWPTELRRRSVVPLIAIDHVLTTADYSVVSTGTTDIPGTDHRALVARLDRR